MRKTFTGIFIKPGIGIKELAKYGFKEGDYSLPYYWRPSFTCADYEKEYYQRDTEYLVYIFDRQIIIRPMGWSQLSGKIQTLLFDMFTDGIVEKKTYEYGFNYKREVVE